ncbi:MAG: hypothetical protein ACTS6P_00475 [Candidatus Hodgkinia cicadicola]
MIDGLQKAFDASEKPNVNDFDLLMHRFFRLFCNRSRSNTSFAFNHGGPSH